MGLIMAGLSYDKRKETINHICKSKYSYIGHLVEKIGA